MRSELHRHTGGSITPEFVWWAIKKKNLRIAKSLDEVRKKLTFVDGEKPGFTKFLKKFDILNQIPWDEKLIAKSVAQIVWNLAKEKIDYAEIDFTIGKYQKYLPWKDEEIVQFIANKFREEGAKWGIQIGLILCLKYESPRGEQEKIASLIETKAANHLVGIDLVGNEKEFDKKFYAPILKRWREAGKGTVAHVGESQTAKNVEAAVEIGVDRIAHGIRVPTEIPKLLPELVRQKIVFEIAISSNLMTGVVKNVQEHPLRQLIEAGAIVTIGTDDPIVCNTTLDKEYVAVYQLFNNWWKSKSKNEQLMMDIMENSIKHAFSEHISRLNEVPTTKLSYQDH